MTNRIRALREARGLSQAQLANLVNTTNQHVSRLETGRTQLTTRWMQKFATALDCQSSDLLDVPGATVPGLTSPELIEHLPSDPSSPLSQLLDRVRTAVCGNRPNAHWWQVQSRALELAGLLPGDFALIDLDQLHDAERGDIVCAQLYEPRRLAATTVLRVYQPPYLVAASIDPGFWRPIHLEEPHAVIMGVCIFKARPLKGDELTLAA